MKLIDGRWLSLAEGRSVIVPYLFMQVGQFDFLSAAADLR